MLSTFHCDMISYARRNYIYRKKLFINKLTNQAVVQNQFFWNIFLPGNHIRLQNIQLWCPEERASSGVSFNYTYPFL